MHRRVARPRRAPCARRLYRDTWRASPAIRAAASLGRKNCALRAAASLTRWPSFGCSGSISTAMPRRAQLLRTDRTDRARPSSLRDRGGAAPTPSASATCITLVTWFELVKSTTSASPRGDRRESRRAAARGRPAASSDRPAPPSTSAPRASRPAIRSRLATPYSCTAMRLPASVEPAVESRQESRARCWVRQS